MFETTHTLQAWLLVIFTFYPFLAHIMIMAFAMISKHHMPVGLYKNDKKNQDAPVPINVEAMISHATIRYSYIKSYNHDIP